ncbi:hypothetical protein [Nocardia sp. NPDC050412]|uniref:hypothetical protein n=1 Tax=Nocardia sp. NPDC050412 TaxID=3364320 RepID=UPI00378FDB90
MIDHRVHRHHGDLHMIMVVAYSQQRENLHRRCAEQFRHEALQGGAFDPSHRQHRVVEMPGNYHQCAREQHFYLGVSYVANASFNVNTLSGVTTTRFTPIARTRYWIAGLL